ncbi:MAG: hypothetical protein QM753_11875 [Thermomicrobiales bacterium]
MKSARYSLIRYIPDLARNEPVNIGIAAWTDHELLIKLSKDGLDRAFHSAPDLSPGAFEGFEDYLCDRISRHWKTNLSTHFEEAESLLASCIDRPATVTPSLFVGIDESRPEREALELVCAELDARLIRPPRRYSGRRSEGLVESMRRSLSPFLAAHKVHMDHEFKETRSGLPQTVDFFVNSGSDIALDVLAVRSNAGAESILLRSSAQAAKVIDIRGSQGKTQVSEFLVYAPVDQRANLGDYIDKVRQSLSISDCRVLTSRDEVFEIVRDQVGGLV